MQINSGRRWRAWRDVLVLAFIALLIGGCPAFCWLLLLWRIHPVVWWIGAAMLIVGFGAAVVVTCVAVYRDTLHNVPRGVCAGCGYDLTGNVSGVCPECGASVSAAGAAEHDGFKPR